MKKFLLSTVLCSMLFSYEYNDLHTRAIGLRFDHKNEDFGKFNASIRTDQDLAQCITDQQRNDEWGVYSCMKLRQIFVPNDHFGRIFTPWEGNLHLTWKGWYQNKDLANFKSYMNRTTSGYSDYTDSRRFRENVFCINYEDSRAGDSKSPIHYDDFMAHQKGSVTQLHLGNGKNTIIDYDAKSYYYGEGHIQDVFREFAVNTTGKILVVAKGDSPFSYFFSEQFRDDEVSTQSNGYRPYWYDFSDFYLGYQHGETDATWPNGTGFRDKYVKEFVSHFKNLGCVYPEKGYSDYQLFSTEDFNNAGYQVTNSAYYTNDKCARTTEQIYLKNNALYGEPNSYVEARKLDGSTVSWDFMKTKYFIKNNGNSSGRKVGGLGKCYTLNMDYYDGYSQDGLKTYYVRNLRIGNFFYNNNKAGVDARYTQRFSPLIEEFNTSNFSIHKTRDGIDDGERKLILYGRNSSDKRYKGFIERPGIMPKNSEGKENLVNAKISLHLRPTSLKNEYYLDNGKIKERPGDSTAYAGFNSDTIKPLSQYYEEKPKINANFKVVFYPDANKVLSYPTDETKIMKKIKDDVKLYKFYKFMPKVGITPLYDNGGNDDNLELRYSYKNHKDYNECFDPKKCKEEDLIKYKVKFKVSYKELAQDGETYVATTDWKTAAQPKESALDIQAGQGEILKFLLKTNNFAGLPGGIPLLIRVEVESITEVDGNRPMFELNGVNVIKGKIGFEEFIISEYKSPTFGTAWNKNDINKKPTVDDYKKGEVIFGNDTYTRLSGESVYIGFDKYISNANIKFSMKKNGQPYNNFSVRGEYDYDVGKNVNTNSYGSNFIIEVDKPTAGKYEICYESIASNGEKLGSECSDFAIRPSKATIISKEQKAGEKLLDPKEIKIKYEGTDGNYSTSYEEAKITVEGKTFDVESKNTTNRVNKVSSLNPAPVVNERAGIIIAYPFASDVELKLGGDTLLNDDKKGLKCDASSTSNKINPVTGMIGCDYEIVSGNIAFKSENADELSDPKVNDPYTNSVLLSDDNLSHCMSQSVCAINALEQDYNIREKGGNTLEYVYKKYDDDKKFEYKLNFANNKDPEYKERFRVYTNIENDGININQNQITINGNISKDTLNKNFNDNLNKLDMLVNTDNKKLSDVVNEFNANPIAYKTQVGYTKYEKVVSGSTVINKNPVISKFDFTGSSLDGFSTSKDIPFIFAFAEFKDAKAEKGKVFKTIKADEMYIMYLDENKVSKKLETSVSSDPYYTRPRMDILNGIEFKSDYLSDITKTTDGITITLHKEKQKSQYVKDVIRMRGLGELDAKKSFTVEYILN